MIYVIIAIGVFFLGFIIYTIVSPMKQRGSYETNLKNVLNELGEHELIKVKNVPYDFNLKIKNKDPTRTKTTTNAPNKYIHHELATLLAVNKFI